jgi:hypothetical protein
MDMVKIAIKLLLLTEFIFKINKEAITLKKWIKIKEK